MNLNGQQQLVAFIGVALVLGNLITNRAQQTGSASILQAIFSSGQTDAQLQSAHAQLRGLLLELAGLVVLVLVAGLGGSAASLALVFVIGLALVWLMTWLQPHAAAQTRATARTILV